MKYFKVTFIEYGEKKSQIIKEKSLSSVIKNINNRNTNIIILDIKEVEPPLSEQLKIFKNLISRRKINLKQYYISIQQIASLVNSGISLKETLYEIGKQSSDKLLKEIFMVAADRIKKGGSIEKAFYGYEKELGLITFSMLRLSEKTGDIVKTFYKLSEIYKNIYEYRKKIKKALRYPIIVSTAIIIAFTLLMVVVVPKFEHIFKTYGAELPLPTKILLFLKEITVNYGIYLLFLSFIGIIITIFLYKTRKNVKKQVDKFLLKVPIIGNLIYYSSMSQIFMLLSNLIESGNGLIDSINITIESINNEIIKEKLVNVYKDLKSGKNVSTAFENSGLLDKLTLTMIITGEKSGELGKMLVNINSYYKEKEENIIENMSSYIEPIMLIIIASMVLLIALGVFLPMWNMSKIVH